MFGALLLLSFLGVAFSYTVDFDGRSMLLDGKRELFVAGSFHYPRAPRSEWNNIFTQLKNNGINLIQTYVFWDIHEPVNNEWYFPNDKNSSSDLVGFIQEAGKLGFYVNLRISGYVCAEWNFGGLPVWLRNIEGTLRSYDEPWLAELTQFTEKVISEVSKARLFPNDNGPIVLLQIENEYGNVESAYGAAGVKYVEYLSEYVQTLDVGGAKWIMCQQGEGKGTAPAAEIINTCNGFYCDSWIETHAEAFPNQPHFWTENWPGWFQNWGQAVPHRPAVDVAYSVARWFARGGSYMNYYMAFGGTNFGRSVGGPNIITSYDYDVQVNEFGLPSEPKFTLLQQLHSVILENKDALLNQQIPVAETLPNFAQCESHKYQYGNKCVLFLSNTYGDSTSCLFPQSEIEVPSWSVSILTGENCDKLVYNTKNNALSIPNTVRVTTNIPITILSSEYIKEVVPSQQETPINQIVNSVSPLEQLGVTGDSTDFLWYSTVIDSSQFSGSSEGSLSFTLGTAGGAGFYVFVDGKLVYSTLNNFQLSEKSLKPRRKMDIKIPLSSNGQKSSLEILCYTMGLLNFGKYYDKQDVGIVSDVTLDGVVLSNFKHTIGLIGEQNDSMSGNAALPWKKSTSFNTECVNQLCWHKITFSTPTLLSFPLAFDMGVGFGKGALFLNGNMLGRFWDLEAQQGTCRDCSSATYSGHYFFEMCRTGCGSPSQQLYKVPVEWFKNDGSENVIVVLSELRSDLKQLKLVEVSSSTQ